MDDGNARCLGYRPDLKKPYQYLTYKEVFEKARDFGSALINKLHLKPGDETYLGIYARNCPEWFISAFGCTLQSVSIVPLYDTFGPDAITYILQQVQMTTIVVDTFAKAEKLLAKSEQFPSLKTIIVIEEKLPEKLTENYRTVQVSLFYRLNDLFLEFSSFTHPVALITDKEYRPNIIALSIATTALTPYSIQAEIVSRAIFYVTGCLDAIIRLITSNFTDLHLQRDSERRTQRYCRNESPKTTKHIHYLEFKYFLHSNQMNVAFSYTSGTTSFPKGVIISHRNIVANLSAFYLLLKTFSPDFFMHNPVSEVFVSFHRGNIQLLTEDLADIQPNLLPVVPRLLNRFYDLIQVKLKKGNPVVRALFNYAYQKKLAMLKEGIICNDTIWDKLIFQRLQAKLGGKVQFMAIGSAPISAEVLETCRVVFGAVIIEGKTDFSEDQFLMDHVSSSENVKLSPCDVKAPHQKGAKSNIKKKTKTGSLGYGQTECTALATSTWPCDTVGGHCGGPSTCTLLKLADVPELNYFARERKGEILLKGPSCTAGYFKDPQKTAELYDEDGFLHTGDIGEMLPDGTIRIIDRKKHIFKLAQGEYVAPEKIESVYIRAPCVQQIFVDGNSYERYLIAIVVPDEDAIKQWLRENITSNGKTYEQLLKTKEVIVQSYVLEQLTKIGKENNLNSMEQVRSDHFVLFCGIKHNFGMGSFVLLIKFMRNFSDISPYLNTIVCPHCFPNIFTDNRLR
ncbi:unnamed protein product [Anisakis simplex]|uniref:long-chain-fatty-acid--CoA ligase n=1 Tax=Anisakis simplex TaxID=6269 RepID=A0A3P6N7M4_ANISI|nr:unnamed protein product [Anisakis simplex]